MLSSEDLTEYQTWNLGSLAVAVELEDIAGLEFYDGKYKDYFGGFLSTGDWLRTLSIIALMIG